MGQETFEDNKMKNYGERKLKRAHKIDEGEDDFEADFQAFSKKCDEEDESHYKFMALLPFKEGLTSVSTPTEGKVRLDFPMKGMICSQRCVFVCSSLQYAVIYVNLCDFFSHLLFLM